MKFVNLICILALALASEVAAQVVTCNLSTPPCSSPACRWGCAMPLGLSHASQRPCGEARPGGSFDLTATHYAGSCALGMAGCWVDVPPLRFWQYDAYANANSGCLDLALDLPLVNTALDLGGDGIPGHWQLFQADWMNALVDGCLSATQGEPRSVVELSFLDVLQEGTIQHSSWYLVASVPLATDFDFDRIAGGPGCSPATVPVRRVGGVQLAGHRGSCTGSSLPLIASPNWMDGNFADVDVVLADPSPDYFTEEGRSPASKPLIAGYQILYSGGTTRDARSEPTSSAAAPGGWRPARDPSNPARVAGVVPWGTASPVKVSIPRTPHWYWLATRLVYRDATENPTGPHDPSSLGPLLVSDVSGHCGPVDTMGFWDPAAMLRIESDPAPAACSSHPGDPIDFTVHYLPLFPPSQLDVEVTFDACFDATGFSPQTIPAQVDLDGAPYGDRTRWDPLARKLLVTLSGPLAVSAGRIGIHGLRAGPDTLSCCVEAYVAGGDNPPPLCLAIDSTAACGSCPVPPEVVGGLQVVKAGAEDVRATWRAATDPATVSYNLWEVTNGNKTLVPVANRTYAAIVPSIVNMCPAVQGRPDCRLPARANPGVSFLQVRGVCADRSEGTFHPY